MCEEYGSLLTEHKEEPVVGIRLIKIYIKLCMLLIFSKLKVTKLLIDKYRMHNLYAIFLKLPNICKQVAGNLVNESGYVP